MKEIIHSKGSNLFSGGQLLLMFFGTSGAAVLSDISQLKYISILVWVLVFLKRNLKIDIENRRFKDGLFKSWERLAGEGYISISQKVNEKTKEPDEDSLKLLWVIDNMTKHIYTPTDMEDAKSVALLLEEKWNCKVYLSRKKSWFRE